jgi:hypothetical protein
VQFKIRNEKFKIGANAIKADEIDLSISDGRATSASFFISNFKF